MDSNNINISFGLNVSIPPNILKNLMDSSSNGRESMPSLPSRPNSISDFFKYITVKSCPSSCMSGSTGNDNNQESDGTKGCVNEFFNLITSSGIKPQRNQNGKGSQTNSGSEKSHKNRSTKENYHRMVNILKDSGAVSDDTIRSMGKYKDVIESFLDEVDSTPSDNTKSSESTSSTDESSSDSDARNPTFMHYLGKIFNTINNDKKRDTTDSEHETSESTNTSNKNRPQDDHNEKDSQNNQESDSDRSERLANEFFNLIMSSGIKPQRDYNEKDTPTDGGSEKRHKNNRSDDSMSDLIKGLSQDVFGNKLTDVDCKEYILKGLQVMAQNKNKRECSSKDTDSDDTSQSQSSGSEKDSSNIIKDFMVSLSQSDKDIVQSDKVVHALINQFGLTPKTDKPQHISDRECSQDNITDSSSTSKDCHVHRSGHDVLQTSKRGTPEAYSGDILSAFMRGLGGGKSSDSDKSDNEKEGIASQLEVNDFLNILRGKKSEDSDESAENIDNEPNTTTHTSNDIKKEN